MVPHVTVGQSAIHVGLLPYPIKSSDVTDCDWFTHNFYDSRSS